MKGNGVIFLKDWKVLVSSLSLENQLVFWDLFTEYEYGSELICDNPFVAPVWNFIKMQMDKMKESYQDKVVNRNRTNGAKGGRPKKEPTETQENISPILNALETQENPKNQVGFSETQKSYNNNNNENEKNNENVNVILLEKETKRENQDFPVSQNSENNNQDKSLELKLSKKVAQKKVFRPPSVQEVQEYCKDRQNGVSAYSFVNFYQSKDWMVGKNKMKDWQAAVRTWESKENQNGTSINNSTFNGNNTPSGNTYGGFNRKISARAILAGGGFDEASRNSESGDHTIEAEIL